MPKRPTGICVFCKKTCKLCLSHIISGFAYKPLLDNKNRFISFEPVAPEKQRVLQSGYSSYLLCEECETQRNRDYEQPFQLEMD